jgi:hypothetical protein
MTHLTEEDLILHYNEEAEDGTTVENHLHACTECRAAYSALERVLNVMDSLPVAERGVDYEAAVWQRLRAAGLRPALWRRSILRWPAVGFALAAAIAGLVFVMRPAPHRFAVADEWDKQILSVAVSDYLDRSAIVLTELANATAPGELDISAEQERAADLVAECRLYRQTATRANEHTVLAVLDQVERVLLEIAHAPSRLDPAQVDELRARLRSEGVLIRIRGLSSTVRNQDTHKL